MFFTHFSVLHKNLSILSVDTSGKKVVYPSKKPKKFFGACGASSFPQNLKLQKGGFENFWGSGGGGVSIRTGRPRLCLRRQSSQHLIHGFVN